jgi:hypothetical protein
MSKLDSEVVSDSFVPLADIIFAKVLEIVVPPQADHAVVRVSGVDLADTFIINKLWEGGDSSQSQGDVSEDLPVWILLGETAGFCDEKQELEEISCGKARSTHVLIFCC